MRRPFYPFVTNFLIFLLFAVNAFSQNRRMSYPDSLQKRLDTATVAADKVHLLLQVADITMNRVKAGDLADQAIEIKENGLGDKFVEAYCGLADEAVGNDAAALVCNKRGTIERDSLRTQLQAADLMKLEVENEGRRRERLARAEARTEHQPLHHWMEHKVVHYLSVRKHKKRPVEVAVA